MTKKEKTLSMDERKQKIRERYKGANPDDIRIIIARPEEDIYDPGTHQRVAVYARVSTDDPNQTSSYELQRNHYNDMVKRTPNWDLVKIYADEGISGTSLLHRDAFKEMIADCMDGKIDLIITKSVSRFARNTVDCLNIVRQLKSLDPPIGVKFETEGIFTLRNDAEMILSFMATMAQEESHTKSEIMNASIEMRFKRGIFLTPELLGYDKDSEGNLVINQEEAKIVKLIFFLFLAGYNCTEIANKLTELTCSTKKGKLTWSASTIRGVLINERHCGDVLARKTFTPNFLDHKAKKNLHNRNQYYQRDHHEAIISHADFNAVQKKLRNARYGNTPFLPTLRYICKGILKGFVILHPKWAGFTTDDYYNACMRGEAGLLADDATDSPLLSPSFKQYCNEQTQESAIDSEDSGDRHNILEYRYQAKSGDADLRNYQVICMKYFENIKQLTINISRQSILPSALTVRTFMEHEYIEILFHPFKKLFVIRPSSPKNRMAFRWSKEKNDTVKNISISCRSFSPVLYQIMNWDNDCTYRIEGHIKLPPEHSPKESAFLLYELNDARVCISDKKAVMNIPSVLGENYYSHLVKLNAALTPNGTDISPDSDAPAKQWLSSSSGEEYKTDDLAMTDEHTITQNIQQLIHHFEEARDGKQ